MQTRVVHTKIWRDNWFRKLPRDARELWSYLLTCEWINISGVFEVSDEQILFDTSIGDYYDNPPFETRLTRLSDAKRLLDPKALFYEGWVRIVNVDRYNKYRNSPMNEKAYDREMSYPSNEIKQGLGILGDTSLDTSIYTPRNKK